MTHITLLLYTNSILLIHTYIHTHIFYLFFICLLVYSTVMILKYVFIGHSVKFVKCLPYEDLSFIIRTDVKLGRGCFCNLRTGEAEIGGSLRFTEQQF